MSNTPSPMDISSPMAMLPASPMIISRTASPAMSEVSETSSASTIGSVDSVAPLVDRIMVVKCSVDSLGWANEYRQNLNHFVTAVHTVTTHTYSFLKFVFLREFDRNPQFNINRFINEKFFHEAWLSLTEYQRRGGRSAATIAYRAFIDNHLPQYLHVSQFTRIPLQFGQQIATYEGRKIKAAYLNNISQRFGQHYRRLINHFLNIKRRRADLKALNPHLTKAELNALIYEQISDPARRFKLLACNMIVTEDMIHRRFPRETALYLRALGSLQRVWATYPEGYAFREQNIYYDVKANTLHHVTAFRQLALLFVENNLRVFRCFPMRRNWSPSYTTIDTKILCQNIMAENLDVNRSHRHYWQQVVTLNNGAMRFQERGALQFAWMIQTDGVGVSVLKRRLFDAELRSKRTFDLSSIIEHQPEAIQYIHNIPVRQLRDDYANNCVVIDPGRRDLLFCMHENSTSQNRMTVRFTKPEQDKISKHRKYRQLVEQLKEENAAIEESEQQLVGSRSLTSEEFEQFLVRRHEVSPVLVDFYATTIADGRLRGRVLQGRLRRLRRQRVHQPNNFLFRKLRFSRFIGQQKVFVHLQRKLTDAFGQDAILIMGNWSAPHVRYQEPIRGIGMRRMLKKMGFTVHLIDEFRTSSICPNCQIGELSPFGTRINPRENRIRDYPRVARWGLVQCSNIDYCTPTLRTGRRARNGRLYNRDVAACLNFLRILVSIRGGLGIPDQFRRTERDGRGPTNHGRRARRGRPRGSRSRGEIGRGVGRRARLGRPPGPRVRGRPRAGP